MATQQTQVARKGAADSGRRVAVLWMIVSAGYDDLFFDASLQPCWIRVRRASSAWRTTGIF